MEFFALIGENGSVFTVWRLSSKIWIGNVKFKKFPYFVGSLFVLSQYVLNYCLDFGIELGDPPRNCNWNLSFEIDSYASSGL